MTNPPTEDCDRILVIRLSSLGDVLLTSLALRSLRSRFPAAHIDFLTSRPYADLVAALPGVDRVLDYDKEGGARSFFHWLFCLLRERYSVIIDLQNDLRSALWRTFAFPAMWFRARRYRLQRFFLVHFKKNLYRGILPVPLRYLGAMKSLGCADDDGGLELRIPHGITQEVQARFYSGATAEQRVVIFCPGSRHYTKRWPPEKWVDLARALLEKEPQSRIFVLGDTTEEALLDSISQEVGDERVVALSDLSILEAAALMQRSRCTVSNDSGLMHLATAAGIPVLAIFGSTVEEFGFFPFRANAQVLQKELSCRPCGAHGREKCPLGHFRCMRDTSVDEALAASLNLMQHGEPMNLNG
jgi:lipopolysaccharide heptosyltransferase II